MTAARRRPAVIAYAVLVLATLVSWHLGDAHGSDASRATTIVLIVAFVKIHLVGTYFMELRDAPWPLRALFEAYVVAVCTTLVILVHVA